MNWQFILTSSISLSSIIAFFILGRKYEKARERERELKNTKAESKVLKEYVQKEQIRAIEHEEDIAKISASIPLPDSVRGVLERPITSDILCSKNSAAGKGSN